MNDETENELDELGPGSREMVRKFWSKAVGRELTLDEALDLESTSAGRPAKPDTQTPPSLHDNEQLQQDQDDFDEAQAKAGLSTEEFVRRVADLIELKKKSTPAP